jgi:hypothetical protein
MSVQGGRSRNIGIGYMYYLGQNSKNVVFARSDFSVFTIEFSSRQLSTFDDTNISSESCNKF